MQKMFSVTIAFKDWRVSSSEDSLSTGDQSAAVARVADPRNDALSRSRRCSASALFAKGKLSRQFRNSGSALVRVYICDGVDSKTACRPSTQTTKYINGVSTHALQMDTAGCNWVLDLHCEHRGMPS